MDVRGLQNPRIILQAVHDVPVSNGTKAVGCRRDHGPEPMRPRGLNRTGKAMLQGACPILLDVSCRLEYLTVLLDIPNP